MGYTGQNIRFGWTTFFYYMFLHIWVSGEKKHIKKKKIIFQGLSSKTIRAILDRIFHFYTLSTLKVFNLYLYFHIPDGVGNYCPETLI